MGPPDLSDLSMDDFSYICKELQELDYERLAYLFRCPEPSWIEVPLFHGCEQKLTGGGVILVWTTDHALDVETTEQ